MKTFEYNNVIYEVEQYEIEETLEIDLPIKPTAKGRPNFSKGIAYTPKKTRDYEKQCRQIFIDKFGEEYLDDPRPITIEMNMFTNLQDVKKGQIIPNAKEPDIDNLEKAIYDSVGGKRGSKNPKKPRPPIAGIVFKNDGQIYGHTVYKWRANFDLIRMTINYMVKVK